MVEVVRMKEREVAVVIRKEFAKRMKDRAQVQTDIGKLFVANSVTLAPRVCLDILNPAAIRNTLSSSMRLCMKM